MQFLIRPPELEVSPENPFKHDALKRKALEPMLSEFITQTSGPFVLALDSPWGTGKTTFIRMWKEELQIKGYITLYFNAWETDFVDDPLVALIGELAEKIEGLSKTSKKESKLQQALNKTRTIAVSILKRSVPTAVRLLTYNFVNLDSQSERELANLAGQFVEERIQSYEASKSEIKEFKNSLEEMVKEISKEGEGKLPIVFFVDELDRCRPSYAVELLERVKHLFEVEGIVFVLGIDRQQLSHSVRAIYGSQFNAEGYLRRFIDIDYQLPEPEPGKFCDYLFSKLGIDNLLQKRSESNSSTHHVLKDTLSSLFEMSNLSLREQTQILGRLNIVLHTISLNNRLFENVLAICIFLKEWKPEIYLTLINGNADIEGLIEKLQCAPGGQLFNKGICPHIEATIFSIAQELDIVISRLSENLAKHKNGESLPDRDLRVLKILEFLPKDSSGRPTPGFKETIKRISFSESFIKTE
jgi:GTPase SAR1 family protein